MEKDVKVTLWIEDGAVRLESYLEDFKGNSEEWKIAFYEIWRYQMTWDFAYSIRVGERRKRGVYVSLLVKKAYKDQTKKLLNELGCQKINESEENVGLVQTYDIEDPSADNMFEVFTE